MSIYRRRWFGLITAVIVLVLVWFYWPTPSLAEFVSVEYSEQDIKAGRALFEIAGCDNCHTSNADAYLAGGEGLETPFGVFYPPNITPSNNTGIGGWTVADLARSLKRGRAPDGRAYYPAFPYTSYTGLIDEDIYLLYAYLRSVPAIEKENREHELPWYLNDFTIRVWQLLKFSPQQQTEILSERSVAWNRGKYLVETIGHCGECHTPRDLLGAMKTDRLLQGSPASAIGESVPDISASTPHGLNDWSVSDLDFFLESGMLPDGDFSGGEMADVIENTLFNLTTEDRAAMVTFLKDLE